MIVQPLKAENVTTGMTITFLQYDGYPGYIGRPFYVRSVCLPFLIVESFGASRYQATVDTRNCTFGTPSDEYVECFTKDERL